MNVVNCRGPVYLHSSSVCPEQRGSPVEREGVLWGGGMWHHVSLVSGTDVASGSEFLRFGVWSFIAVSEFHSS